MTTVEKEKLCVSCEGRIPLDAEVCSYCAADQTKPKAQNPYRAPLFQNQSLEDSLASLYTPPYQGKRPQFTSPQTAEEEPLQNQEPMYNDRPLYKDVTERAQMDPLLGSTADEEEVPAKSSLWPTVFLVAGANFAFLGLMQLFFSKNGVLRLEWDANYWFFYCILSAPFLFFGYKKLKELND